MNEEQIQRIIARAEAKLAKGCTKEEAIHTLKKVGILDANGELSPNFQYLPYALAMFPNRYKYL
jgi:hypothetical protein